MAPLDRAVDGPRGGCSRSWRWWPLTWAVVSFYERRILPVLFRSTMRQRRLGKYRRHLIPTARGRVLEIGIGSGLNLPLYGEGVDVLVGLDPSERLLSMAHRRAAEAGVRTALLQGTATRIPLGDATVEHGGDNVDA